jgi:hypothetical protein
MHTMWDGAIARHGGFTEICFQGDGSRVQIRGNSR